MRWLRRKWNRPKDECQRCFRGWVEIISGVPQGLGLEPLLLLLKEYDSEEELEAYLKMFKGLHDNEDNI